MEEKTLVEFNTIAKPKLNIKYPTTVAEIRNALNDGVCVEWSDFGTWFAMNPWTSKSNGAFQLLIAEGTIRFNLDKKVVFRRDALFNFDGDKFFYNIIKHTANQLNEVAEQDGFVEWVGGRSYIVLGKDVHV